MDAPRRRVCIDARMVGPVLHGVARYVTLMAEGLAEAGELPYEPVFLVRPGFAEACPASAILKFETLETDVPFLAVRELWELPGVLRRTRADLYHSPTFSALVRCPCPWLVTVHDLNHLQFGNFVKRLYYRAVLRPFVRRARAVLTVSEFSKREIVAWAGLPENAVEVAYNALDPRLTRPVPDEEIAGVLARHGLRRGEYIFCLANAKPHKNIPLLVDAYRAFRKQKAQAPAWPLVLSMREFQGDGIVALGALPERETRALLAGAGALFSPSIYEGFGLPPVEAVLAGVPVAVSRIPPHEEGLSALRRGEVLWVEASDFHGWTNAFHRASRREIAIADPQSRARLAANFTPTRLGRHMDQVYRRVLEHGEQEQL